MTFFPPRWVAPAPLDSHAGGWSNYTGGPEAVRSDVRRRYELDVLVVESEQVRITVPAIDVYADHISFDVLCVLQKIRGGVALRDLLDALRDETPGASPPENGLLVGIELQDGTRARTYPTGAGESPPRLQTRGGSAHSEGTEPATVRQELALQGVPDRPFRIVCSFAAVDVIDASVVVNLQRG